MNNNIFIRKVKNEDIEDVFNLSNQDYVRKYSINKDRIKWEDHVCWFNNIIQDFDNVFYKITDSQERFLGQIRFKIEHNKATVSISLSKLIIGKGLSSTLLTESIYKLFHEKELVNEIIAYVSQENIASIRLFQKAGFSPCENKDQFIKYSFQRGA